MPKNGRNPNPPVHEEHKTRLPQEGEILGIAQQMLGFDRVKAKCMDGHERVCRIRGKMKKRVWIRPGDIILLVPWDFQSDEKADIIWRYSASEAEYLQRRGFLKV